MEDVVGHGEGRGEGEQHIIMTLPVDFALMEFLIKHLLQCDTYRTSLTTIQAAKRMLKQYFPTVKPWWITVPKLILPNMTS